MSNNLQFLNTIWESEAKQHKRQYGTHKCMGNVLLNVGKRVNDYCMLFYLAIQKKIKSALGI